MKHKSIIVIFGATGDLAKRKLFPSIYRLYSTGKLDEDFAVVGVARTTLSNDEFRESVKQSSPKDADSARLERFASHFYYQTVDATDQKAYQDLKVFLESIDEKYHTDGNRIFYLAMAPEFFGTIGENLKSEGLTNTSGWSRLIIEKPFGHDYDSAEQLNEQIRKVFTEEQIYRIDHYLGKEMVQNITVIRFANAIFEALWNNQFISNVQITSSETLGVEDRGRYYESSGALLDMVQNHILQIVALLAMEPPIKLTREEIHSEKVKVLRALRPITTDQVDEFFVRGQYGQGVVKGKHVESYREEHSVDPVSNTETFVAGKLLIDNFRWAGVPFYIRTGKRMAEKSTEVVIQFKELPMNLYLPDQQNIQPNLLVIHIQPDEGITLHLNAQQGSSGTTSLPIQLDYCINCDDKMNTPEAYERLIYDCMRGDATHFTHWDEVALSWKFVDPISKTWKQNQELSFPNYESGSLGPQQADALLAKDGVKWWPIWTHRGGKS